LIIIGLCSVTFKLYLVDFSIPETGDSWIYILRAISNSQGYFAETPEKTQGWNMFLSPFFLLIDSENYLDYVNIARILSIIISVVTIIPMFLVAKKFFNEKYSLIATFLFAFQPQLHYNASLGFSEPLFFLILISSVYLFLNKQFQRGVFLAFILLGILVWSRILGVVLILPFLVSYFIVYKNTENSLRNFFICIVLFLIIISPILGMRYIQYDDPVYFWYPTAAIPGVDTTESEFLSDNNMIDFFYDGTISSFNVLAIVSLPYLIFLFPIGMYFSINRIKSGEKNFRTIWIMLILSIIPFVYQSFFSMTNEARHLFHIYPFLIIFSTLTIQTIIEKEGKPFSKKQKKSLLVFTLFFILITSTLVTVGVDGYGYGRPDKEKTNEIREYSKFLINELDGKLFWSKGVDADWVWVTMIEESEGEFRNHKINPNYNILFSEVNDLRSTNLYVLSIQELNGDSLENLIINGNHIGLKYISVGDKNEKEFFDDIFYNEKKYSFLKKIFDSNDQGFQKYQVKTFEIDYEVFNKLNEN